MACISKTVDVDVEIELDDVLDFINGASQKEKQQIQGALTGERTKPDAPFLVPIYMQGHAAQLIALGRLEELLHRIGVEDAVALLAA